jgi:Fe(3+) dicitrate transport protein
MKRLLFIIISLVFVGTVLGQTIPDSLMVHKLSEVTVEGIRTPQDIQRLEPIQGTYIFSGKKSEVIDLTQKNVAITEKYGRQIFSKIPGVFVYDMDGTGNQMNISTRGLDPHRGWEFNIRKDGIITNSDMYGYPASHYNIPMEAVERIELVRGTGSLQYGGQFGGMLNYISKQPDITKKISFESINTIGSYGLLSTYNSLSGKVGKIRYSAWMNKKALTGYRANSESQFNAEGISIYYDATKNLQFKFDWTHSNYLTSLAGALNDSLFRLNPRMATRSRNYYNPNIHVPSIKMDWKISASTQLSLTTSAVLGTRNSVMFDKPATVNDTINPATLQYSNRQVDIDNYNSYTTELRVLHSYKFLKRKNSISAGIQYMNNDMRRRQQGVGTTGSNFDLTLVTPAWGRDLNFRTNNIAIFAENLWVLSDKFSINTGVRIEIGKSDLTGTTAYYLDSELPNQIKHSFPLFGVNAQYNINQRINLYAGWSQAYRPVILKDIVPQSVFEITDNNLKDAFGYNAELGFRDNWKFLKWDATAFYVQYNNRLGTVAQTDTAGNLTIFRTNIGNSNTKGFELFLQSDFTFANKVFFSLFTSTSLMDARYQDASIRRGNENVNVSGNKVESVPTLITRNGVNLMYKKIRISMLYSYTTKSFADAFNTTIPPASGATGLVPSYQILDLNIAFKITNEVNLQFNLNNLMNESYFTKRPQFYPGPGIWPSDGRTFSATVLVKI